MPQSDENPPTRSYELNTALMTTRLETIEDAKTRSDPSSDARRERPPKITVEVLVRIVHKLKNL